MAASKKKPALSPAAAKILEQYRSSGQPKPGTPAGAAGEEGNSAKPAPTTPPPSVRLPKASGRGK
jgi:hypothetical protein